MLRVAKKGGENDVTVLAEGLSSPKGIAVVEGTPSVAVPGERRVVRLGKQP